MTDVRKGVTKRTAVLKNRRVTISDKFLLEYHGECVQSWMKKSHRIGLRLSYCNKPSKTFQVSFVENHLATCGWFERRGIEIAHSDAEWMQKGMCRRPVCLRLNMLRRSGRTLSPSSCQKQILMEMNSHSAQSNQEKKNYSVHKPCFELSRCLLDPIQKQHNMRNRVGRFDCFSSVTNFCVRSRLKPYFLVLLRIVFEFAPARFDACKSLPSMENTNDLLPSRSDRLDASRTEKISQPKTFLEG